MKKQEILNVYIIGIGGKGLNSVAEFCLSKGYNVAGSDCKESSEIISLQNKGVNVFLNQSGRHINSTYDVIVYSSVIPFNHPERKRARDLNIRQMSRARFLKHITDSFVRISIAGSHGKSTTSALTSLALESVEGAVNSITGAYIKEYSSYQKTGNSPYCVVEACEYSKSFLHIPGDYTIITSLEKSHMEYFKTEEYMNNAFEEFISRHKPDATLLINGDIPQLRQLALKHRGVVVSCGFNHSNDFIIKNTRLKESYSMFDIYKGDKCIHQNITIKIPGTYNILNVALAICLLYTMRYTSIDSFRKILIQFTGVGRRFEKTIHPKVTIIDDFAHHPTQVKNLIASIKQCYPDKKILAIFEPRQAHLIKTFIKEYGHAFKNADEVCVTDVVPALGDTVQDISSIHAKDVIKSVQTYSKPGNVWYARSYQEIADIISLKDLRDVVVATIGAGSIFRVKELLLNRVQ